MKLDPQKTASASIALSVTLILDWVAKYFYHVPVPDTVSTAFVTILTVVLSHVPFLSVPSQAG